MGVGSEVFERGLGLIKIFWRGGGWSREIKGENDEKCTLKNKEWSKSRENKKELGEILIFKKLHRDQENKKSPWKWKNYAHDLDRG